MIVIGFEGFHHCDLDSSWIYEDFNFSGINSSIDLAIGMSCHDLVEHSQWQDNY